MSAGKDVNIATSAGFNASALKNIVLAAGHMFSVFV